MGVTFSILQNVLVYSGFHFGSLHLGHYKMSISNITLHLFNLSLPKRYDAGRDWGQEEKGMTEDKLARWHQRLDGHEFE